MAVSIATITNLAIAVLTPGSAYGTLGDSRFFTTEFSDMILSTDGNLVKLILNNPSHGRRRDYVSTASGFVSGATLPSRVGPIESVQFVITGGPYAGQTLIANEYPSEAKDWINQENQSPQGLMSMQPKYCLEGSTVVHNAAGMLKAAGTVSISVNVAYTTYTRTAACQAPDEMYEGVLAGALAMMFDVEGENPASAQRFQSYYQLFEQAIVTGSPSIPQLRIQEMIRSQAAVGATPTIGQG